MPCRVFLRTLDFTSRYRWKSAGFAALSLDLSSSRLVTSRRDATGEAQKAVTHRSVIRGVLGCERVAPSNRSFWLRRLEEDADDARCFAACLHRGDLEKIPSPSPSREKNLISIPSIAAHPLCAFIILRIIIFALSFCVSLFYLSCCRIVSYYKFIGIESRYLSGHIMIIFCCYIESG